MSLEDEMRARRALTIYLTDWGVDDAPRNARKFIDELVGQGWQMSPRIESRPQPPRGDEVCHECQRHTERCVCDSAPMVRPRTRAERQAEHAAELKRIKAAATAGFCSHGVAPDHCHETHDTKETA